MKRIRDSIKLLRFNLSSILIFEVMFKVISYALLTPFLYWILNFSIKCAGISYLTKDTVDHYFKSPFTYFFILLFLLVLAAFLLVNISGLIYAMEAGNRMQKISAFQMLAKSIRNAFRVFYYKNIPMLLYVLVLLPITNITMVSATMLKNVIPEYILEYFQSNKLLANGFLFLYVILCFLSLSVIYTLNYFTLKKRTFGQAVSDSRRCVKNNSIKPIFGILFWNIMLAALAILLGGVLSGIVLAVIKKLITYKAAYFILDSFIQTINLVIYAVYSMVVMPLTYAYICNSFYDMEDDGLPDEQSIDDYKDYDPVKSGMRERAFVVTLILIALTLDVSYLILRNTRIITIDAEFMNTATVTAHRGDSRNAPENTLSAFELAIENQADVIELDVRQTRDGKIIVMHDESLERTIGVDKRVGDLTYEELLQYDAGIMFSEEFAGEKIPTLEEAILCIDGRADMNIELKPSGTDQNLEECVAEIVKAYDLYDHCVVTSLDYNAIRRIKQYDEEITTVYVMSVAAGNFYNLEYADAFSIKYSYITTDMVKQAHKRGKGIYAWTVNSEEKIKDMMMMGVDSIITDNPYRTKKIMYNSTDSIFSSWFKKYLNGVW